MAIEIGRSNDYYVETYLRLIGGNGNNALRSWLLKTLNLTEISWKESKTEDRGFNVRHGYCSYSLNNANQLVFEVALPVNPTSPIEIATYIEEFTHLIHIIVNPEINIRIIEKLSLGLQLQNFGLDSSILELFATTNTDFLTKANNQLDDLAKNLGFRIRVDSKDLLQRFFMSERGLPIVGLAELILYCRWFLDHFPQDWLKPGHLEKLQRLHSYYLDRSRRLAEFHNNYEKQREIIDEQSDDIQLLNIESEVRKNIVEILANCNLADLAKIITELSLTGLDTLARYNLFLSELSKLPPNTIKEYVVSNLNNFSDNEVYAIFYQLRPVGYYHGFRMDTFEYLRCADREERIELILERMQNPELAGAQLITGLFHQQFSGHWAQGVATAAAVGLPDFWDISPDNPYFDTKEYAAENIEAIKAYLSQRDYTGAIPQINHYSEGTADEHIGNFDIPTVLSNRDPLLSAFRLQAEHVVGQVTQARIYEGINGDNLIKLLAENLVKFGQRALSRNVSVSDLERKIGLYLNMYYEHQHIQSELELILELVAKAIVSYYSGKEIDLPGPQELGEYTLKLSAKNKDGSYTWAPFFKAACAYLEREGNQGIMQLLTAKSVRELANLVGLEP